MPGDDQVHVIQKYIAAYNAFDVEAMLALLSPAVRFENWSGTRLTTEASGIDEFRQLACQAMGTAQETKAR